MKARISIGIKRVLLATVATLLVLPTLSILLTPHASASSHLVDKIFYTNGYQLVMINPDGSDRTTLDISADDYALSPDGTKIAYVQGDGKYVFNIYVMNADGSGVIDITPGDNYSVLPAWSPDGTKIAFWGRRDNNTGAYIMNADGSDVHLAVPDVPGTIVGPVSWSPDGTKIVFGYYYIVDLGNSGTQWYYEIGTADIDGTGFTQLTSDGDVNTNSDPAWSPDGTRIAWISWIGGDTSGPVSVNTMRADGTDKKVLFTTNSNEGFGSLRGGASWSSDSSKIIFGVGYVDGTNRSSCVNTIDSTYGTTSSIYCDPSGVSEPKWGLLLVPNINPSVGLIAAPTDPVTTNVAVSVSANFTDGDITDTHTATWSWGDGSTSAGVVSESNGSGNVTGNHTYTQAGVYTVSLSVADHDGATGTASYSYVVVYNPSPTAALSGSGKFTSQTGWDSLDPSASGQVKFGATARYTNGNLTAQAKMNFKNGNLDFNTTSCQWLVVNGTTAQLKCTGTVNGSGSYSILVTATDGGQAGGNDKVRIKITTNTDNSVIYDTQLGDADIVAPTTVPTGGSINIHN